LDHPLPKNIAHLWKCNPSNLREFKALIKELKISPKSCPKCQGKRMGQLYFPRSIFEKKPEVNEKFLRAEILP
jgi:hypothetical protein